MMKEENRRDVYIDILRIFACLMVIFNHSNERGFYRFLDINEAGLFSLGGGDLLCSILCKSAVPIFFMISGSLLLRKEESIAATYQRIPKMLADLVLFSLFYFWTESRLTGNTFLIWEAFQAIVQNSYWHMWYLYAYIAFIITLPVFRRLVKGLDIRSSIYLFMIAVVVMGILPIVEYFWIGINSNLKPAWLTVNIFIYPVIGYAIDQILEFRYVKWIYIMLLWMINIFSLAISGVCEYFFLMKEPGNSSEVFLTNFCLINAAAVFITVKYFCGKMKFGDVTYKIIVETGKCTFGIYLFHIWFLCKNSFFYNIWEKIEQGTEAGKHIGIFISCILVFALAGIITHILRKIPLICRLF